MGGGGEIKKELLTILAGVDLGDVAKLVRFGSKIISQQQGNKTSLKVIYDNLAYPCWKFFLAIKVVMFCYQRSESGASLVRRCGM